MFLPINITLCCFCTSSFCSSNITWKISLIDSIWYLGVSLVYFYSYQFVVKITSLIGFVGWTIVIRWSDIVLLSTMFIYGTIFSSAIKSRSYYSNSLPKYRRQINKYAANDISFCCFTVWKSWLWIKLLVYSIL